MRQKGFAEIALLIGIIIVIGLVGLSILTRKNIQKNDARISELTNNNELQLPTATTFPVELKRKYFTTYYLTKSDELWGFADDGVYYGNDINSLKKMFSADLTGYFTVKNGTTFFGGPPKVYYSNNKEYFVLLDGHGYGPGMVDIYLKVINLKNQLVSDFSFSNVDNIKYDDEEAHILDASLPNGYVISEPESGMLVIGSESYKPEYFDILKINLNDMTIKFLVEEE